LANLDHQMRNAACLAMSRQRIVEVVINPIGLVIADPQIPVNCERMPHQVAKPMIPCIGDTHLPGARPAVELGAEAVDTQQQRVAVSEPI
jgi:hypothetical protein